eukprot:8893878-Ditylum_brightwellii.AAC.1
MVVGFGRLVPGVHAPNFRGEVGMLTSLLISLLVIVVVLSTEDKDGELSSSDMDAYFNERRLGGVFHCRCSIPRVDEANLALQTIPPNDTLSF